MKLKKTFVAQVEANKGFVLRIDKELIQSF